MIYTITSWVFLALTLTVCIVFNHPRLVERSCFSAKAHKIFCLSVFAAGCIVRLVALGTLPFGPTAEEALVAVQGKSLWQTGHFIGIPHFTAQFQQWGGDSAGPFLAVITAPFVGIFGINAWTARLPLVLLSILAMIAMYGVGWELGGERAGRYALLIEGLCPYFVLASRLTASSNAGLFLFPIAFYGILRGMREHAWLYPGTILTSLLAYTQDLYFFIAPALLLSVIVIGLIKRASPAHVLVSGVIGLMIVTPAVLTAVVNLTGREGFTLGIVEIPKLVSFDKSNWLGARMYGNIYAKYVMLNQFWTALFTGGIFQCVSHENISKMVIEPDGFYALYTISFPMILLGCISLVHSVIFGDKTQRKSGCVALPVVAGIITAVMILFFGSERRIDYAGLIYCYDYSTLFFFDALLMIAGFTRLDRKSRIGTASVIIMLGVNFILLCVFLFGGEYSNNFNVNFPDFREASIAAHENQKISGAKIHVTNEIFPHIDPDEGAKFIYLYSIDADMRKEEDFDVIYPPMFEQLDEGTINIVYTKDTLEWNLDSFDYQEFGRYALLTPIQDK